MMRFKAGPEGANMPPQGEPSLYDICKAKILPLDDTPPEEVGRVNIDDFLCELEPPELYAQLTGRVLPITDEQLPEQNHTVPIEDIFPPEDTLDRFMGSISLPKGPSEKMECVQETLSRKALGISTLRDIVLDSIDLKVIDGVLYIKCGATWYEINESGFSIALSRSIPEVIDGLSHTHLKGLHERILITPSVHVTRGDLEREPNLIPCNDGVYDVMTDKTYDSDLGKDFLYCVNVGIREIGRGSGQKYERYLEKSFGDAEAARICYEQCQGVILSGYTPRKIYLYAGPTGSGKSVSANLLIQFLTNNTDYGSELAFIKSLDDPNRLSGDFGLSDLPGKQLCYCGDTAKVLVKEPTCAILKQLSGGDLIRVERKHRNSFECVNQAKILLLSNNPLRGAIDDALRDRMVVVPFSETIPESERIAHYDKILYEERGYIFYRYMQALRDLIESNFEFEYVPGSEAWISGSTVTPTSSIESFLAQMCVPDSQACTPVRTLHQAYLTFCERAQYSPLTDISQFGKQLLAACPTLHTQRNNKFRSYCGIALRQEP